MKLRNIIAREQFLALDVKEQEAIKKECQDKYEKEMAAWQEGFGQPTLNETTPEMEAE